MTPSKRLLFASAMLATTGCGNDFSPYNFIEGFRVLGVSASEPALEPGATTTLSTLVAWGVETTTVTYSWSWCPVSTGSLGGFECALTEEQAAMAFGLVPAYDLGTTSSVAFTNPIDPVTGGLLKGLCTSPDPEIPQAVKAIGCAGRLPITFRADISDDDETITVIKEVFALLEPDPNRNTNPVATGLVARRDGVGDPETLDEAGTVELIRGQVYEIEVQIDPEESETFTYVPPDTMMPEDRREALTFSWFVNAGDTDRSRTKFVEGEVELVDAVKNEWTIPRKVDFDGDTATIVVVIRDGRNGTTWIQRTVRLSG